MSKKRELIIKRFSDGEIASRMDVTGKSERTIERIMAGALINMNTDEWCIYDTDWDEDGESP